MGPTTDGDGASGGRGIPTITQPRLRSGVAAAIAIALPAAALAMRVAGIPRSGFDAVLPHVAAVAAAAAGILVIADRALGPAAAALAILGVAPTLATAAWLDGLAMAAILPSLAAVACAAALARGLALAVPGVAAGLWLALLFRGPLSAGSRDDREPARLAPVFLGEMAALSPIVAAARCAWSALPLAAAAALLLGSVGIWAARRRVRRAVALAAFCWLSARGGWPGGEPFGRGIPARGADPRLLWDSGSGVGRVAAVQGNAVDSR